MAAPALRLPPTGVSAGSFRTVPTGQAQDLAAELEDLGDGAPDRARDIGPRLLRT